ncbi:hypothetical protein DRN45_05265 [Thermococci archaeon]|nr:MAG: hypothetical protein DRN45_05265 [Thermococci archaeon]RLF93771.1 MAG: hypothetical protein DRN50_06675 [Thermococci archaeon]
MNKAKSIIPKIKQIRFKDELYIFPSFENYPRGKVMFGEIIYPADYSFKTKRNLDISLKVWRKRVDIKFDSDILLEEESKYSVFALWKERNLKRLKKMQINIKTLRGWKNPIYVTKGDSIILEIVNGDKIKFVFSESSLEIDEI